MNLVSPGAEHAREVHNRNLPASGRFGPDWDHRGVGRITPNNSEVDRLESLAREIELRICGATRILAPHTPGVATRRSAALGRAVGSRRDTQARAAAPCGSQKLGSPQL